MKSNPVLCFFFFILLVFNNEKSLASHAVGADLTYVCLGGNNYRFFFTLYRDCQGIAVSPTYTIAGNSTCGGNASAIVSLDSTNEITHTCPAIVSKCINPSSPYFGIQVNYYHGDVTLPSVCNSWTFGLSTAICNRSAVINNLDPNGATYCLYVQATLNNSAVQCNNSPAFSIEPVAFLCANQVQFFHYYATDPDNDSLHFEMYTPHSDPTNDVQYNSGLSGTQPVTYLADSTRFDSTTGEIRFLADGPQITVVAMRVSEYRNGVLIGSVERDIQLIFENCSGTTPNPPLATGINGTTNYSSHICYDSVFTFLVYTSDPDGDSTFIGWDHQIQDAMFTIADGIFQTGVFSWHPDTFDISTSPHTFTVYVTDNSCPALSQSAYTFQIFVDSCHAISQINDQENSIQFFTASYSGVSNTIHIIYQLRNNSDAVISLYDLTGRKLKVMNVERSFGRDINLSVPGMSSGMYLLNLKTGDGVSQTIKIAIE